MSIRKKNKSLFIIGLLLVVGATCRIWVSQLNWMHYDENYYLDITQNYIARGEITPYMWRLGDLPIIAGGGSGYGILLLIAGLQAIGNSLVWGRILMAAVNLISAGVIYWVARKWWTSRLAGQAAFGYAIVATSSFNTIIVKMDALGILSYSLILLLYVYAYPKERFWLHFLVGVGIVATAEFHILGVIYMFALAACIAAPLRAALPARLRPGLRPGVRPHPAGRGMLPWEICRETAGHPAPFRQTDSGCLPTAECPAAPGP